MKSSKNDELLTFGGLRMALQDGEVVSAVVSAGRTDLRLLGGVSVAVAAGTLAKWKEGFREIILLHYINSHPSKGGYFSLNTFGRPPLNHQHGLPNLFSSLPLLLQPVEFFSTTIATWKGFGHDGVEVYKTPRHHGGCLGGYFS